jgi:hypothetical protein
MEKLLCQRQQGLRTHDPLRPCRLRQGPGMKTPPRPLSQKRVAEGLLGRVRRARRYVLWQAADAAALYTFLFGLRASLGRFLNPFRRVHPVTRNRKMV